MQPDFTASNRASPCIHASRILRHGLWIQVVKGGLFKPMTVMHSCHKASISDSHAVHHPAPEWTGLGQMPGVGYE